MMAPANLYCTFLLLLYLQGCYGQQGFAGNQNLGLNNQMGMQQSLQRTPNNINQIQNGGGNINLAQPNLQQSLAMSGAKQGNLQQQLSIPPNLQSQSASTPQNNLQITKIGFTPVSPGMVNNPSSMQQLQNTGVKPNVQVIQSQNMPISNAGASQISNGPISTSTLAELAALKGQPSLLSLLNPQNVQPQRNQNQQFVMSNSGTSQNQLTDVQKQFLVKALQNQFSGSNQQGINGVQAQSIVANLNNNQQAVAVRTIEGTTQGQAIVTPIGNQPAYITVQAQPLATYLQNQSPNLQNQSPYIQNQSPYFQNQSPQVVVEQEPSIMSMLLSELGPQYSLDSAFSPKKGSKMNIKSLIPLIINMLKEKNGCGCRNCGCSNNPCGNNGCPTMMPEPQMAQIFGGYSNQKIYGQDVDETSARIKKNDNEEARNADKERNNRKQKVVKIESEETSEEDDSEYFDEDE